MQSLLKSTTVALTLSLSAVTLMAVPTLCVQAATPTDKSLRELVEVTQLNETIKQMSSKDSMQKLVNDSMISSVVSDDINNVQRQQLIAVISDYSSSIFDDAYIETINEAQMKKALPIMMKELKSLKLER